MPLPQFLMRKAAGATDIYKVFNSLMAKHHERELDVRNLSKKNITGHGTKEVTFFLLNIFKGKY